MTALQLLIVELVITLVDVSCTALRYLLCVADHQVFAARRSSGTVVTTPICNDEWENIAQAI